MQITAPALQFPVKSFPGTVSPGAPSPSGIHGEVMFSALGTTYSTLVKSGKVQTAYATVTTPAVFSTTSGVGLGGPLLWNPPSNLIDAHLIAVSAVVATAATSSVGGLGLTMGLQPLVPTTTTAIDAKGNALMGGPASALSLFRIGTVNGTQTTFFPLIQVDTGAITTQNMTPAWNYLDGSFVINPGYFGAITGSVLFTTLVINIGLMWAELPF